MALVTICTCRACNKEYNCYDHETWPSQVRAHRAYHYLGWLVWRDCSIPGSIPRRYDQPGPRAGASRLSRDGFDHLVRHCPAGPCLTAHRGCLVTGYQVGLVPVLLDTGETPDNHPCHPHLAGTYTAS